MSFFLAVMALTEEWYSEVGVKLISISIYMCMYVCVMCIYVCVYVWCIDGIYDTYHIYLQHFISQYQYLNVND